MSSWGWETEWSSRKRLEAAEFIQKKGQLRAAEGTSQWGFTTPLGCKGTSSNNPPPSDQYLLSTPGGVCGTPGPCCFIPRICARSFLERLDPIFAHFIDKETKAQGGEPGGVAQAHKRRQKQKQKQD